MLNKVILTGRLTADPELKHTPNNVAVCAFTIAVERNIADKSTGKRATDFIEIVAWRNTAEFISKYFSKGRMITIAGSIQTRSWEDKNGNKRKATEILAEEAHFADSKKDDQGGGSTGSPFSEYEEDEDDGNLPF